MAFSQQLAHTLTVTNGGGGNETYAWQESSSAGLQVDFQDTVADSATDQEGDWTCDVSELKSLSIVSTQAILLEINDGAGAGGSFTLVADQPMYWSENMTGITNPLGTDVTSIFWTNSSGSSATVTIRSVQDPTP